MAAMPAAEGLLPQQWLVPNEGGVVASDGLHRRAAEVLVTASSVQMETETDGLVEVWTISSDEGSIRASAPRVRVRDDMLMRCRLLIDSRPYLVMVTVADATGRSAERASITLNVIRVTLDVQERSPDASLSRATPTGSRRPSAACRGSRMSAPSWGEPACNVGRVRLTHGERRCYAWRAEVGRVSRAGERGQRGDDARPVSIPRKEKLTGQGFAWTMQVRRRRRA
jgi:hypothetical protein